MEKFPKMTQILLRKNGKVMIGFITIIKPGILLDTKWKTQVEFSPAEDA